MGIMNRLTSNENDCELQPYNTYRLTMHSKLSVQKQNRIANVHISQKRPLAHTHAAASSAVDCAH